MTNEQLNQFIREHGIEESGRANKEFDGEIYTTVWFSDNENNHVGIVIENLERSLENELYHRFSNLYKENESEEKYYDYSTVEFLKYWPDFKRAYDSVKLKIFVSFIKSLHSENKAPAKIPSIELAIIKGIYDDDGFDPVKDIYEEINDDYVLFYDKYENAAYIVQSFK